MLLCRHAEVLLSLCNPGYIPWNISLKSPPDEKTPPSD
jgi:hypothetical protein